jgi:hypothetical protein
MSPTNFQSRAEKASESSAIRARIGRQLRATPEPDLEEPLPARLTELLRRLAQRDKRGSETC